jgi:hypothetical protein
MSNLNNIFNWNKVHKIETVVKEVDTIDKKVTKIKDEVSSLSELESDDPAYNKYQELSKSDELIRDTYSDENAANQKAYIWGGGNIVINPLQKAVLFYIKSKKQDDNTTNSLRIKNNDISSIRTQLKNLKNKLSSKSEYTGKLSLYSPKRTAKYNEMLNKIDTLTTSINNISHDINFLLDNIYDPISQPKLTKNEEKYYDLLVAASKDNDNHPNTGGRRRNKSKKNQKRKSKKSQGGKSKKTQRR